VGEGNLIGFENGFDLKNASIYMDIRAGRFLNMILTKVSTRILPTQNFLFSVIVWVTQ